MAIATRLKLFSRRDRYPLDREALITSAISIR
jgi:hypothetical protein